MSGRIGKLPKGYRKKERLDEKEILIRSRIPDLPLNFKINRTKFTHCGQTNIFEVGMVYGQFVKAGNSDYLQFEIWIRTNGERFTLHNEKWTVTDKKDIDAVIQNLREGMEIAVFGKRCVYFSTDSNGITYQNSMNVAEKIDILSNESKYKSLAFEKEIAVYDKSFF